MPIRIEYNYPAGIAPIEDTKPSLGKILDRSQALTIQQVGENGLTREGIQKGIPIF